MEAANIDGLGISVVDADARAGVAALLTPDAEALAAVCNSDSDSDKEDLDTGDVTIREGERERRERGTEEREVSWLGFSTTPLSTSTPPFKKKKKIQATSSRPTSLSTCPATPLSLRRAPV